MDHDDAHDSTASGQAARPARRFGRARAAKIAGGTTLALGLATGGFAAAGAASTVPAARATTATSSAGGPASPLPGGPGWGPRGARDGLGGLVTAVGTGSITVQTPAGTSITVSVDSSTTFRVGRTTTSLANLSVGEDVAIRPTSASAGSATPVAASVVVVGPSLAGRVVSVSGADLVVADAQGFYRTIVTSSATTVTRAGATSSLAAVAAGTEVRALGTVASDHTELDATSIDIVLPRVAGTVSAVDTASGTITLSTRRLGATTASTVTVATSSSTRFTTGASSSATSLSAVKVGDRVVALGTPGASSSSFSAVAVAILPAPGAGGGPGFGPGFGHHGGFHGGFPGGPGGAAGFGPGAA